jgi:hypothetical protein
MGCSNCAEGMDTPMDVRVRLGGDDVDDAERADLARDLQAMLRVLDEVEDAALVLGGPTPAGAKSGGVLAWGALVVSLVSAGSFQVVIDTVASWLRRQPADIEIEIDGQRLSGTVTREQRDALVQTFLARTGGGAQGTAER